MVSWVFEKLDAWISEQNRESLTNSSLRIAPCTFKIVGQTALIEADLAFDVTATTDLDAFTNAPYAVVKKFDELLAEVGLKYDMLSSEIWMPAETSYVDIFNGSWVTAQRSDVAFIMVSKAKMNPEKNRRLLQNYIASEPNTDFFELCSKYQIDLEPILGG